MNFVKIVASSDENFELTWHTYSKSFPDYEKRILSLHKEALSDTRFEANAIYDDGIYIGFIFFWTIDNFIYIEHFAIEEIFRNKSYGSKILKKLIHDNNDSIILLEIDPPNNDISKRRLNFYKRLGFYDNNIVHYNLPYKKDLTGDRLNLLTYKRCITDDEYRVFHRLLMDSAFKYCQKI